MTTEEAAVACAIEQYCEPSDNNIECDDIPVVSGSLDGTHYWVQAWLCVRIEDIIEMKKGN